MVRCIFSCWAVVSSAGNWNLISLHGVGTAQLTRAFTPGLSFYKQLWMVKWLPSFLEARMSCPKKYFPSVVHGKLGAVFMQEHVTSRTFCPTQCAFIVPGHPAAKIHVHKSQALTFFLFCLNFLNTKFQTWVHSLHTGGTKVWWPNENRGSNFELQQN